LLVPDSTGHNDFNPSNPYCTEHSQIKQTPMKKTHLIFVLIIWSVSCLAPLGRISAQNRISAVKLGYITIEGTKQGRFKGESPRDPNKSEITGYSYAVSSQRDLVSGLITGRKAAGVLTIGKRIGASSPQLFQALTTNENLKSVFLEFTRPDANGAEVVYYTLKLTNAVVTKINQHAGALDSENLQATASALSEEVSFSFERIEIESKDGHTMATESWDNK
jgi:type VI secretion system secreted protein Hcp